MRKVYSGKRVYFVDYKMLSFPVCGGTIRSVLRTDTTSTKNEMKERSKESKERKAVVVVEEKKEKETTTTSRAGVPPRATRERLNTSNHMENYRITCVPIVSNN